MKKYIFFSSCDIHDMGGLPLYFLGKAKYLEERGWKVFVFHPGNSIPDCSIENLNKYASDSLVWPEDEWRYSKKYRKRYLDSLVKRIGKPRKRDITIIETYDYWTSPWVELLAKRLHAKHIIDMINELADTETACFNRDIGFYLFKLERGEFFSVKKNFKIVFNNCNPPVSEDKAVPFPIDEEPVQDVNNPLIDSITHSGWNIAYIGRSNKIYLPNIIEGVCSFAKKHSNKTIQFIVLGDFECRKQLFNEKSKGIANLDLVELGNQFPIPRSFFKKVDVVIAGTGSARCAVYENSLTLVADAGNGLCNGLLGYETNNSVYADENTVQTTFSEGLERVLIKKVYLNRKNTFPKKIGVEKCCEKNFSLIEKSDQKKVYYSEKKLTDKNGGFAVSIKKKIKSAIKR